MSETIDWSIIQRRCWAEWVSPRQQWDPVYLEEPFGDDGSVTDWSEVGLDIVEGAEPYKLKLVSKCRGHQPGLAMARDMVEGIDLRLLTSGLEGSQARQMVRTMVRAFTIDKLKGWQTVRNILAGAVYRDILAGRDPLAVSLVGAAENDSPYVGLVKGLSCCLWTNWALRRGDYAVQPDCSDITIPTWDDDQYDERFCPEIPADDLFSGWPMDDEMCCKQAESQLKSVVACELQLDRDPQVLDMVRELQELGIWVQPEYHYVCFKKGQHFTTSGLFGRACVFPRYLPNATHYDDLLLMDKGDEKTAACRRFEKLLEEKVSAERESRRWDDEYLRNCMTWSPNQWLDSFNSLQAAYDSDWLPDGFWKPQGDSERRQFLLLWYFHLNFGPESLCRQIDQKAWEMLAGDSKPLEGTDPNKEAYGISNLAEQRLAEYCIDTMHRKFGDQWYDKVDYGSRKQLERQLSRNTRKDDSEPWKHANLGFWQGVINNHWPLFQPFVEPALQGTKWKGRTSDCFRCFVELRNDTMHRPFKPPMSEADLEDLKEILRIIQTAAASFENTHG